MPQLVTDTENFGDKAPIVEALIDLPASTMVGVDALRPLAQELREEFPSVADQMQWGVQVQFNPLDASAAASSPATPRGFLLHNADRTRAVQIRRDGFTMSHLRPYRDWDSLKSDAARLWRRYVDVARPQPVPRVAVRYINRLELPPDEPLPHWLRIGPAVPSQLQFEPAAFAMRTLHGHPHFPDAVVIVNLLQEQSEPPAPRVIVFDIDCSFQNMSLSPSDPAIWDRLDDLHNIKNDIFFSSITDNTRSLLR